MQRAAREDIEAIAQGCEPDRSGLLAAHLDLRPDMEAFVADLAGFRAAGQL